MLLFTVLYAILPATGYGLDAGAVAAGAAAYWLVYGLAGIVVWNILKYAIPAGHIAIRTFIVTSSCIMMVALVTGAELLAVYASLGSLGTFLPLLPAKVFISSLAFVILCLFYRRSIDNKPDEDEPAPVKAPRQEDIIERITVKGGQKIKVIPTADIEYLQADGDYVSVVTCEGRWLKEQTMKYFEEHLPADRFIRIHRSYIVNMSKISRIERYGNLYQVVVRDGEKIKVSATGYKLLKERLKL